jgi:hypothetical protein
MSTNGMDIDWLPPDKECAVCLSIDDVHPARSTDYYEAGGDLGKGVLGNVEWLLSRHKDLKVTLFTTANWREISDYPTRKILARIPYVKDRVYLAKRWPKDRMRVDRHPEFVAYLNSLPRTEIGFHGLNHCHKGPKIPIEFQNESIVDISRDIDEMELIFKKARLKVTKGMCPPGWNAPPPLLEALKRKGFIYVASARDLFTPINSFAKTNMSGLKDMSLIYPQLIDPGLIHFSTNFQATSHIERAKEILDLRGLLSVKGHTVKIAFGSMSLDGIDQIYANYLDMVFREIEHEYGNGVWWASMGEIAERLIAK